MMKGIGIPIAHMMRLRIKTPFMIEVINGQSIVKRV